MSGLGLAASATQGLSAFLPKSFNRNGWQEVANKLSAYRTFASADRLLPSTGGLALAHAFDGIHQLDPYHAVWAMEGVGYYHAQRGGRLRSPDVDRPPRRVGVPLHTGAGLAWAEAALRSVREVCLGRMLGDFWERCRTEGQDGYQEALFEALGLVAANLYPNLVGDLARHLADISGEQSDLFWHGVGRGLYFAPVGFIPFSEARHRAYQLAQRWPVNDTGRQNAMAGLAWAMTLVNIRDPQVVETALRESADEARLNGGFRNGMTSALIVWLSAAPADRYVDALGRFEPAESDSSFLELWEGTVRCACRDARRFVGAGSSDNLAAQVFRVRPLPA